MDPAPGLAAAAAGGSKSEAPSTPALHGLPVEMTTGEMEAAIAALPAKKEALREAFDVLAACSPFPVPFVWADLDSYISSLQSSIDRRFGQLRVLEAARPALAGPAATATSDGKKGGKQEEDSDEDEEDEDEDEEEEIEEEVEEEEEIEEEEVEEEEEEEVREEVDEEQQGADEEMQKSKDADEASKNMIPTRDQEEQEAEKETIEVKDEEQHGDKPASQEHDIGQDEDEEAEGEQQVAEDETMEAKLEEQNEAKATSMEQDIEEEEGKKAKKASLEQGNRALPSCGNHLRGVCAGMDVRGLLNLVCKNQSICLWHEYPVVMRHAPDAAALVLQVVQGFLVSKKIKTSKVWGNCVGLIRCLPAVNASLSADTMKQAKQLAKDWKEMIDRPGSSGDVLNLSSWGLLYFVISYNIVSEFSVDEIFCIFGTLSRKQQKKNGIELCKGLGLVDRITDLIDYLIGNGQQLEALLLTQAFNLIDKYTPLSLLKGYVERAKQNALDIINMNSPRKSLSPTITKEVGSLMVAQNIVQQQITDFNVRSGMLAEIKKLLDQYATKRSSGDACAVSTSNSQQQQQKHTNKKRKREQLEQQQHKGQEIQEQKQQIKPQGKKEQPQTKPEQKKQQQQNTNKPQEQQQQQQHQKQQIKPQGKMGKEQTKPGEQQQQQKTKRPQEQQQKQPQKKQQQQQQQQQSKSQEKRPRPRTTKLPISSIPASISPMVPHIVQVDSFGHSPYAAMPGSHTYAAQLGWSGIQSAAFAQNVGVSQFMGLFNPQQPNYPFYRHPPFYPR